MEYRKASDRFGLLDYSGVPGAPAVVVTAVVQVLRNIGLTIPSGTETAVMTDLLAGKASSAPVMMGISIAMARLPGSILSIDLLKLGGGISSLGDEIMQIACRVLAKRPALQAQNISA